MVRRGPGVIDVAPFQERYHELLERGETPREIAWRGGFISHRRKGRYGDVSWLQRSLGVRPVLTSGRFVRKRYSKHAERISHASAERLCLALNVDPVEVGL